jgi:RNA polymerase sigma factor (sigma-70 family)
MATDCVFMFANEPAILGLMSTRPLSAKSSKPAKKAKSAPAAVSLAKAKVSPESLPIEDDRALIKLLSKIAATDKVACERALGEFYDATVSRVYGVALRIVRTPELAEEVVSDVYMQVWRDASRYDVSRGKVLGWLLIIARTRSLDLLRKQDEAFSHPAPYDLVTEPEDNRDDPQDLLAALQSNATLHAALSALSPLQRQLLAFAFFRGMTHSEIVEHTNLPLGSVKTHIRRALLLLREHLGEFGDAR